MRILTQLARPGVTLAQAVVTADGLPLFGKGTQLTRRHLRSLYEDGVRVLRVVDDGTMEDWETVPEVPAYAAALDARFERVADDRDMQALKRAVKRVYVDFLLELEDA
jgi:hypothetical protein